MKKIKIIFFLAALVSVFASCESDEEKYSGTPVGNQDIETIQGNIELLPGSVTKFMSNQKIPVKITLPFAFQDSVTVEVSSITVSGGRTRISVIFVPGQTVSNPENIAGEDPEIPAAGGAIFNTTMEVYLSGIALSHAIPGKHYLLTSEHIVLNTGNTTVPGDNANKLQTKFAWFNPESNDFKVFIDRPNFASWESGVGATNTNNNPLIQLNPAGGVTTAGLQVGMAVQVSSGKGNFGAAVVTSVESPWSFKVSVNILNANSLSSTSTIITAGGYDKVIENTNSVFDEAGITKFVNVASTVGLNKGMTVWALGGFGTGAVRGGTIINRIISPTQIELSLAPLAASALVNAKLVFSYPDILSPSALHDITNLDGPVSTGQSSQEGEYTLKLVPITVREEGADIPYRIVWKFPNGSVGYYESTFEDATALGLSKKVLKVNKSGTGPGVIYTVTGL